MRGVNRKRPSLVVPNDPNLSLVSHLFSRVSSFPTKPALIDADSSQTLSFAQLKSLPNPKLIITVAELCSICDQWKKKYLKVQESRNALRQAVKVLELKINEIQAQNQKACVAKLETGEKLEELNARVPSENEICSIKSQIASPTIQQGRGSDARELMETENSRADSEMKKAAEAWKLLQEEKNKTAEKGMQIARIEAKAEE
ncbi:hypothetical protein SESBI_11713 [Sesbania bispinosa]|nr:hypothetical protein SESBI_11713 [Sesbania bispinosa]